MRTVGNVRAVWNVSTVLKWFQSGSAQDAFVKGVLNTVQL